VVEYHFQVLVFELIWSRTSFRPDRRRHTECWSI